MMTAACSRWPPASRALQRDAWPTSDAGPPSASTGTVFRLPHAVNCECDLPRAAGRHCVATCAAWHYESARGTPSTVALLDHARATIDGIPGAAMHDIAEPQDNMFRNIMGRHLGSAQPRWGRLAANDLAFATSEEKLVLVEVRRPLNAQARQCECAGGPAPDRSCVTTTSARVGSPIRGRSSQRVALRLHLAAHSLRSHQERAR